MKLFPQKSLTSKGKLQHHCEKAKKTLHALTEKDEAINFFQRTAEFEEIGDCLVSLGLSKHLILHSSPSDFPKLDDSVITHEVVMSLYNFSKKERLPLTFVTQWLCMLCNFACSESQMRLKLNLTCKKVTKMKKKNQRKIQFGNFF